MRLNEVHFLIPENHQKVAD